MPSLRSAWAGAPAIETPRQSVPMLTVAAALAIIVALGTACATDFTNARSSATMAWRRRSFWLA